MDHSTARYDKAFNTINYKQNVSRDKKSNVGIPRIYAHPLFFLKTSNGGDLKWVKQKIRIHSYTPQEGL